MGNLSGMKGLTTSGFTQKLPIYVHINPFTPVSATDFTLSYTRQFYSSMGNPSRSENKVNSG